MRWSLLTDSDRRYAESAGYQKALLECGVGGVAYASQVKCLHVHYAHYLATGKNLIGEWVSEELAKGSDSAVRVKGPLAGKPVMPI
jgi:hypothetical protein